jgi:redox-sensing transcriptional repressor
MPPEAPEPTIARLALYLRSLRAALRDRVETMSSAEIEQVTGISSGQVRKDLSYFGEFGKPGMGYSVAPLVARLSHIMRLDREQPVLIVGAGNLGAALAGYANFGESHFRVAAIYDNNFNKIGRKVWELEILDVHHMPEINREMKVELGIIATPAGAAREVVEIMVRSGVKGILNFAPVRLAAPAGIALRSVDLTQELEILSYLVASLSRAAASLP